MNETKTTRTSLKTEIIKGWLVTIGKAASGGWLAKASREGVMIEERDKTRKATMAAIAFAIDIEMDYPCWKKES